MLKSYEYLRKEILFSIEWQHKFVFGEASIIGLLLSVGLTQENFTQVLVAIPPTITVLSSLWLVEQTRMMRAGDFMQFLEHKINLELHENNLLWENWLRRPNVSKFDPHRIHHYAQYVGVLGIFLCLGFFSVFYIFSQKVLSETNCIFFLVISIPILSYVAILTLITLLHKRRYASEEMKTFLEDYKENLKGY